MDENNSLLDWDRIMETAREEDRAEEEIAFQRYRASLQSRDPKQLKWAASETSEIEDIRERIGAEFEERCPINLKLYSAKLYVLDRTSALLIFRKGNEVASDLNGKTVDFFLVEKPSSLFSETIQEEEVVIDFQKLGISIEEYERVAFRIHLDGSTVIEERLGDELS